MTTKKHTSGPWEISRIVTQSDGLRCFHIDSETDGPIGYFDSLDDPDGDDEANARLIAAAPELLEACRASLEYFGPFLTKHDRIKSQLREAIAKAKTW